MDLPYLKGALTKDDLRRKDKFDYLPWAKCLQVVNSEAPGWMPERGEICHAADTSVWIKVRWVHVSGEAKTPWFDYALRDFRNKAVLADKATAKAICDATRRAYCASAAAFFSLNYETYVDEEFEPQDEPVAPRASATPASIGAEPPLEEVQGVLIDLLAKADAGKVSTYLDMRAKKFGLTNKVSGSWIAAMSIDQLQTCIDELKAAK
nr:unnamed protein product [uncultured Mediterranean phage uvMED]